MRSDVKSAHAQRFWVSQLERRRRSPPLEIFKMQSPSEPTRQRSHPEALARAHRTYVGKHLPAREQQETNSCHGLPAGHLHGWPSAGTTMEARGSPTTFLRLQPADDPHFYYLDNTGTLLLGPCGPGGRPYGRREHVRFRRSAGRNLRDGKGVNRPQTSISRVVVDRASRLQFLASSCGGQCFPCPLCQHGG